MKMTTIKTTSAVSKTILIMNTPVTKIKIVSMIIPA
jgi:hypothetical protein